MFDGKIIIFNPNKINIGNNCTINEGVLLQACENARIEIGDNVVISYRAMILTGNLNVQNKENKKGHIAHNVTIGNEVWIGAGTTILPGITIGNNVIIGAGSTVTKSIKSGDIVAGNPARPIKKSAP